MVMCLCTTLLTAEVTEGRTAGVLRLRVENAQLAEYGGQRGQEAGALDLVAVSDKNRSPVARHHEDIDLVLLELSLLGRLGLALAQPVRPEIREFSRLHNLLAYMVGSPRQAHP